jgi:glycine oxidase
MAMTDRSILSPPTSTKGAAPRIRVVGAGVLGLTCAHAFAQAGCHVDIVERAANAGLGCSFYAGGMLAPWCEAESAEPLVVTLGQEALTYWTQTIPVATSAGSLVVAPARDRPELLRFSRQTTNHSQIGTDEIAALEPDLEGRFGTALFYAEEAHLDPRAAVAALVAALRSFDNVTFHFDTTFEPGASDADWTIDTRGFAAQDRLADLRGVKGEMVMVQTKDIALNRPVRLLHPRHPVYIVPRGDGRFMIGATMIESEERGRVTARSLMELLGAAYTVHPAFGEAEVLEIGCDVRPAFPDNLPRIRVDGRTIYANGLFRHGFLLSPALAARVAATVLEGAHFPEVSDADPHQRRSA